MGLLLSWMGGVFSGGGCNLSLSLSLSSVLFTGQLSLLEQYESLSGLNISAGYIIISEDASILAIAESMIY